MRTTLRPAFAPGQAIRTFRFFYWHKGIATDQWLNGEQFVISCSGRAGKVVVEPMSVFTRDMTVERMEQLSGLPPAMVLRLARQMLGKPYSLVEFNCEHFLYKAFGLVPQSPQLATWIGLLASVAVLRAL